MNFPLCVYGKEGERTGQSLFYSILYCHEAFSGEALSVFIQVRKAFHWRTGGKGCFPPHYAYWPLSLSRGIAFRFLDSGRDSLGRPHTLRLEAALVAGESWEAISVYIAPASWPERICLTDTVNLSFSGGPEFQHPLEKPVFLLPPINCECVLFDVRN